MMNKIIIEMKKVNKTTILLKRLTIKESNKVFQLSQEAIILGNFLLDLQLQEKNPTEFTQRLLWLSKGIYSIRLYHKPEKIIGYALFYKLGKTYYEGLCILPSYYHPSILEQTREQLAELAKFCYGVKYFEKEKTMYTSKYNKLLQGISV